MNNSHNQQFYAELERSFIEAIERTCSSYLEQDAAQRTSLPLNVTGEKKVGMMITISSTLFRVVMFLSVGEGLLAFLKSKNESVTLDNLENNDVLAEFANLLAGDLKRQIGLFANPLGMSTPVLLDPESFVFVLEGSNNNGVAFAIQHNNVHLSDIYLLVKTAVNMDEHITYQTHQENDVSDGELELF